MVFAAGLGTRLLPLTTLLPKPVVPLLHRPLAAYAVLHLAGAAGATDVVLNTHHLAARAEDELRRALPPAAGTPALTFAHETRLLGTGGGVKNAVLAQSRALGRDLAPDEPFVAFNGDILFAPDLLAAIALHRDTGAIATMIVRVVPAADAARLGAIELDEALRVRRILATPDGTLRATMFTGVHVLSARAVADLPDEGCIVRQGYARWLARGEIVAGFVDASPWRDLGTPREYLAAHVDLLRGVLALPGGSREARDRAVHPDALVDPAATLVDTCVGPRAHVAPGVRLERCVVWPDTVVAASAADAILAPGVVVAAH